MVTLAPQFIAEHEVPTVLPPEEGRALFDRQARCLVGMSGEEFLAKWDASEYQHLDDDSPEDRNVSFLALLIPFGRQ